MREKKKIISKLLVGLMIFNMCKIRRIIATILLACIIIPMFSSISLAATPQEDLDKGMITLSTDTQLTLRKDETYYVMLSGASGGGSGGYGTTQYYQRGELSNPDSYGWFYWFTGGSSGSGSAAMYYKVEVINDVTINLKRGSAGNGGSGPTSSGTSRYTANSSVPYDWRNGTVYSGGSGGANGISGGTNGSYGGSSSNVYSNGSSSTGGGGGGGGAAAIYFNSNVSQYIHANGGSGRSSSTTTFYYGSESNPTSITVGNGGSGGSGGVFPVLNYSSNPIPNVKISILSSAEGSSKIGGSISNGAVIKKELVVGAEGVLANDIPTGSNIILTNSIDNSTTTFAKQSDDTFMRVEGASYYYVYAQRQLEWYAFSKYAVSGSGTTSSLKLRLKEGLRFIGGDGSVNYPYYPEAAGSISGGSSGGGGSSTDSYANTETLANSIVSVAKQIEEQLLYQKEQDVLSSSKSSEKAYVPFSISLRSANNLTATKQTYFDILLSVNGRKSTGFQYNIAKNGVFNDTWSVIPSNNVIRVTALGSGYNSIIVSIRDESLDTQSEIINVWKLQ